VARNDPDSKVPVVIFRKPAPLPEPHAETEIGSSIVARERKRHTLTNIAPQTVAIIATVGLVGAALAWFFLARTARTAEPLAAGAAAAMAAPTQSSDLPTTSKRPGPPTGAASVVVRTEQPGLTVLVDGSALSGGTPAKFELTAGTHAIEIARNDATIWQHEFTAAADTHYEFHPVLLGGDVPRKSSHRRHHSRSHRVHAPTIETPAEVQTTVPQTADAGTSAPAALPAVGGEPPPAPPPRQTANELSNQPVVVPPSAVRRVSGRPPTIPRQQRAQLPPRMSAKICINRRGRVTAVTVLTEVSGDVARVIEKALTRWRYRPYRSKGTRVSACFAVSFATR
jgi:hypothetical protein